MRIHAQLMMVMALDKCLGCHACSVSCRRAWTDRPGSEHAWFNHVETRPGLGYPRGWDGARAHGGGGEGDTGSGGGSQEGVLSGGGWELDGEGHLRLREGVGSRKRPSIFRDRAVSGAEDYYEPWTYDFGGVTDAPLMEEPPVAGARSLVTGEPMVPHRGPNWDDDLAGIAWPDPAQSGLAQPSSARSGPVRPGSGSPGSVSLDEEIRLRYEQIFMLYLPRICNHCLNPSCAAACPSKAVYKRSNDGIVLVDQDRCRGRHSCVAACPYKKVYVNRLTEKAEKCMFCLPGVTENGLPPLCAETCVGRIRSVGVVLYDAEAVAAAAEVVPHAALVEAQRRLLLDPNDSSVLAKAQEDGVPHQWLEAARRSPVYALAKELRVALPLHPEFRTLPMVWYVPPLSPVLNSLQALGRLPGGLPDSPEASAGVGGEGGTDMENMARPVFGSAQDLRIPLDYLAELFAAGNRAPVEEALNSLIAMREFKRSQQIHGDDAAPMSVGAGIDPSRLDRIFRLLGISERKERFVIPTAQYESARSQNLPSRLQSPGGGPAAQE